MNEDAIRQFIFHEARLIDEKRFDEWYELFRDDAFYWMPLTRGQPDGVNFTSLLYEDKLLLKVRVERLKNAKPYAQQQPSYCQHVLQWPSIEAVDAAKREYTTRTAFTYVESKLDQQITLAGVAWHHLVSDDSQCKIRLKKVELVNCDAALPSIQLFP
jgi:3-phenylpropionate/cinnamic acid dioxygenase small subunit